MCPKMIDLSKLVSFKVIPKFIYHYPDWLFPSVGHFPNWPGGPASRKSLPKMSSHINVLKALKWAVVRSDQGGHGLNTTTLHALYTIIIVSLSQNDLGNGFETY